MHGIARIARMSHIVQGGLHRMACWFARGSWVFGFVIATLLILAAAALGVVVLSVVRELSSIPVTRLLFEGA